MSELGPGLNGGTRSSAPAALPPVQSDGTPTSNITAASHVRAATLVWCNQKQAGRDQAGLGRPSAGPGPDKTQSTARVGGVTPCLQPGPGPAHTHKHRPTHTSSAARTHHSHTCGHSWLSRSGHRQDLPCETVRKDKNLGWLAVLRAAGLPPRCRMSAVTGQLPAPSRDHLPSPRATRPAGHTTRSHASIYTYILRVKFCALLFLLV